MAEINLETKIQYLQGVGPKIGAKLNRLGIEKVGDLLMNWPRRYEDYTDITQIKDLSNEISNFQFPISNQFSNFQKTKSHKLEAKSNTIRARIVGIANKRTRRRGFTVTEAVVEDGSGSIKVVWFNQPHLIKMLWAGSEVILNGKIEIDPYSRELSMISPNRANKPKIVPVYGETAGLSSYYIAKLVSGIRNNVSGIKEFLPEKVIKQNQLLGIDQAILNIHQPENSDLLERAQERIAFDELFIIALRAQLSKVSNESKVAPKIQIDQRLLKEFTAKLPFKLTDDQKISAWKIISDIKNDKPMNRLLNGDVGSGKTVVAAFAAYVAIKAGFRVAMMAPTEILAIQHFRTCCDILSKFDISVGLVTANSYQVSGIRYNDKKKSPKPYTKYLIRNTKKQKLAEKADLIVGTHALLQDKVDLQNVGLVIVDEQHRFGVRQRQALTQFSITNVQFPINKHLENYKIEELNENWKLEIGNYQKMHPHFLSMTATPIPRTLYLALFSDLDLSVIKTMPKGRKEIKTKVVDEANRNQAYQFIRQQIKQGRQSFVVCPLIEDKKGTSPPQNHFTERTLKKNQNKESNEFVISRDSYIGSGDGLKAQELFEQDRKSVMAEFEKLDKNIFPDLAIGMLHGRMKAKEKEAVMAEFKSNKLNILVSTSVVEVGVDIPNATIMMIEDAERFGLAGMHQFRGRVGRAFHQSYCFLFSNSRSPVALNRLQAMEQTADGFKLAEIDLQNRGAGDIFGTLQSGDLNLKMASLSDRIMVEKASSAAKEIAAESVDKYPALMEKLKEFEAGRHQE